ncbi:MAG: adenylate kinase [Candidatus Eisenbacteria bacterium]|nr:adenylate kinase [Candidatus Eisenbacteria bacterium]
MSELLIETMEALLPPRIWIVGHTGSGKSTLAKQLARRLGVEPTHLDDLFWQPKWVGLPDDEFRARVDAVVRRPSWVVEGNYKVVRRHFWDRADLVVWLDLPLRTTFPRVFWRTVGRSLTGRRVCNGNRESLWRAFFSKDSILLWSLSMHRRHRRSYELETVGRNVLRFRSTGALRRWLRTVDEALAVGRAK